MSMSEKQGAVAQAVGVVALVAVTLAWPQVVFSVFVALALVAVTGLVVLMLETAKGDPVAEFEEDGAWAGSGRSAP